MPVEFATQELLTVSNSAVYDRGKYIEPPGWRVWVHCDDGLWRAIEVVFQSERDASLGLAALQREGLDTEVALKREHDQGRLKLIMCGALAW